MSAEMRAARVRYVQRVEPGAVPLLTFADPAPRHAVLIDASPEALLSAGADATSFIFDVLILTAPEPRAAEWIAAEMPATAKPPVTLSIRGAEVSWRPGRAVLCCGPDQADTLLAALVDFSYYERELRQLEDEIAAAWETLQRDRHLAFNVQPADLAEQKVVGSRVSQALARRIWHSRISPHLYLPARQLSAAGQRIGQELREHTDIEDRLEAVDGHLEVFEHIYEMASQRMGEFRAARAEQRLEWIIIMLLAAETLALLVGMAWPGHR